MTPEEFARLLNCTQEQVNEIAQALCEGSQPDPHNSQFHVVQRNGLGRGLILKVSSQAQKVYFSFYTYSDCDYRDGLRRYLVERNVISAGGVVFDGLIGKTATSRANTRNGTVCDFYPLGEIRPNKVYEQLQSIKKMKDDLVRKLGDVVNVMVESSGPHGGPDAISDSEPNCANQKIGLRVDMCQRLFVLLQQQGAELVGDGVRRPSGKREKREVKLCKIGDVEISFKMVGAGSKLSVKIGDNALAERKNRFCEIFGLGAAAVVYDVALTQNVLDGLDFNAAWITELKNAYTEMIVKLTSATEPPFLYKKFDWRRKQFQTPKGCVEKIQKLESSLLFAMSHGSHELFHTNVWAWLVKKHKEFAHVFFENIDVDAITSITREQGNRDLTIWVGNVGNERAYVIENKFKSVPREEQLDKYRQALGDKFAEGLIVTLDNLPDGFESQGWSGKLQSKVVEEINALLEEGSYDSDPGMKLVGDYAKITSRLSELFSLYRTEMGNRWALALNHNEWDEIEDGDLESIRMADIFKKMNAADLESYLKNQSEWKQLSSAVDELGGFQPLRVHTDFLHKLPVLNCDIVKQDSDGNETSVGIILQGASFGRSAYSNAVRWNDDVADGPKAIYDVLRGTWFDDSDFLRPGLVSRKSSSKKAYKQYDTREYSFTYQDIGIESDRFDYLARMIFESIGREIELIKQGKLADFFGKSADENQ